MPRRRVKCRQKTRSHQHHISPCIINQPFRSVSRLLFIPPIVVLQNGKKRAQMEKSKADEKSMAGFLLYVLGREEKEQENVFLVHHFVFFLCHPSRDVRIPSSISRSTRKSIDFSSKPRSWEIPANFVFRAEFWLTLQLRNKLKQRRRKNKPS